MNLFFKIMLTWIVFSIPVGFGLLLLDTKSHLKLYKFLLYGFVIIPFIIIIVGLFTGALYCIWCDL